MEIDLEPGDPFAEMNPEEYAEFCRDFEQDRLMEDAQDFYAGRCEKCGGQAEKLHGFTSCGVETSYMACDNCGHQWGHE